MNKFNPELPCPHCNAPVKGTLIKGLAGVKQCPSCQKKIKYHKPALGAVFKDIWKQLARLNTLTVKKTSNPNIRQSHRIGQIAEYFSAYLN